MRNDSVNLFLIWASGSGRDVDSNILIWSSGDPPVPVQWSRTIYAILKPGIMRNIHVKLNEIRTSASGGDVVLRYFLSGALVALLFSGVNHLCNFGREFQEDYFCAIILNFEQWFSKRFF